MEKEPAIVKFRRVVEFAVISAPICLADWFKMPLWQNLTVWRNLTMPEIIPFVLRPYIPYERDKGPLA